MPAVITEILSHARSLPEGSTVSAPDLSHLGRRRATVSRALSTLAKRGALLRVDRGLYVCPIKTRFGERPPEPEAVLDDLARRTGETIVTSGAAAANRLGLSTQNPVRLIYLTSGRSRKLRLGKQELELRRAPAWQLQAPGTRAGDVLRALAWLGPDAAEKKIKHLRKVLNETDQAELLTFRGSVPTWLARVISVLQV
jgi:hypothetical protein